MKVKLLSVAEQEFIEIIDYYNDQCQGLGYEFAVEIRSTLYRYYAYETRSHSLAKKAGSIIPLEYL